MKLSDRIRARNGHRKYWQNGTGPASINMLADMAAVKLDQLQDALADIAVRYSESPNGRWAEFVCQLCGAAADSKKQLKHNPDCLLNEDQ